MFASFETALLMASLGLTALPTGPLARAVDVANKHQSQARLETLLRAWTNANQSAREIHYKFEVIQEVRILKAKSVFRGEGFIKKLNFGRVDIRDEKKNLIGIYFWNNGVIESYDCSKKEKHVCDTKIGFAEEDLTSESFVKMALDLFEWERQLAYLEFPNQEIGRRFQARLIKEDKDWAHIDILPKTNDHASIFEKMEIVLSQATHLVRRYQYVTNDGTSTVIDIHLVEINPTVPITLESLSKGLPKGFKEINFPTPAYSGPDAGAADPKTHRP